MSTKVRTHLKDEPFAVTRKISEALLSEGSKAPYQYGQAIVLSRVISETTKINQPAVIAVLRAFVSTARQALDQGCEVVLPHFIRLSIAHDSSGRRFLTAKVLSDTARWLGLDGGGSRLS